MSIIRVITAAASLLCAWAQPAVQGIPGIIGLLELPEPTRWLPIVIYEAPELSSPKRTITMSEDLLLQELDYESHHALIVTARKAGWFQIRLKDNTAWLPARPRFRFSPIEEFFPASKSDLTYLLQRDEGTLASAPGRKAILKQPDGAAGYRIVDRFVLNGMLWLKLEVLNGTICSLGNEQPRVLLSGWVPLKDSEGRLNLWWHTRGC